MILQYRYFLVLQEQVKMTLNLKTLKAKQIYSTVQDAAQGMLIVLDLLDSLITFWKLLL
jgi:hypothetical protein